MYEIYQKIFGQKVRMCSQSYEEKELFKSICKNLAYEIYLDNKNVSNKYRIKTKKETNHD